MKILFSKKHLLFLNFNFEIVLTWRTVLAAGAGSIVCVQCAEKAACAALLFAAGKA